MSYAMNNTTRILVLTVSMISLALFASCKSKAERDAEKTQEIQNKREYEKASEAQRELNSQTDLYEGVAGTYVGTFYNRDEVEYKITVTFRVENKLPEYYPNRKEREGDFLSRKESLTLAAYVTEEIPSRFYSGKERVILPPSHYEQEGIKPDFSTGIIRFTSKSGNRTYEFGFEQVDKFFDNLELEPAFLVERSTETASLLTRNQIRFIDALHVNITTPNNFKTLGWLQRRAD